MEGLSQIRVTPSDFSILAECIFPVHESKSPGSLALYSNPTRIERRSMNSNEECTLPLWLCGIISVNIETAMQ